MFVHIGVRVKTRRAFKCSEFLRAGTDAHACVSNVRARWRPLLPPTLFAKMAASMAFHSSFRYWPSIGCICLWAVSMVFHSSANYWPSIGYIWLWAASMAFHSSTRYWPSIGYICLWWQPFMAFHSSAPLLTVYRLYIVYVYGITILYQKDKGGTLKADMFRKRKGGI